MKFICPANVTVEDVSRPVEKSRNFVVRRGGKDIGYISKFPNRRGEWHPFKAFGPLVSMMEPRKILGFFEHARHGFGDNDKGTAPYRSVNNPAQAALELIVASAQ